MSKDKEKLARKEANRNAGKTAPSEKMVKMKFSADQYYGVPVEGNVTESLKKPLYRANEICDVPEHMVPRWLKRGGVIIETAEPKAEEETAPPSNEEVDGKDGKGEDGGKPATDPKKSGAAAGTKAPDKK